MLHEGLEEEKICGNAGLIGVSAAILILVWEVTGLELLDADSSKSWARCMEVSSLNSVSSLCFTAHQVPVLKFGAPACKKIQFSPKSSG